MTRFNERAALLFAAVIALPLAPLAAQTRTWVSGTGSDANPCSRTAPCQTFAGALAKTAIAGEINCLDPGGFGTVNITKSITIDCTGTLGSVLAANTNGIIVNGAGIHVILRGIVINGALTSTGNGIRFIQGSSLIVDRVNIESHAGTGTNGSGIRFEPNGAAELHVTDSTMSNHGAAGIQIRPTAGGSARVSIRNARILNSASGVLLDTFATTAPAGLQVSIADSQITGNIFGVNVVNSPGTTSAVVMITDSQISENATTGIVVSGNAGRARVANSVITNNGTGVSATSGGIVFTFGNNQLEGNTTDGAFQAPPLPEE